MKGRHQMLAEKVSRAAFNERSAGSIGANTTIVDDTASIQCPVFMSNTSRMTRLEAHSFG